MFARVLNGVWIENVEATQLAWRRLKMLRSDGTSTNDFLEQRRERCAGLNQRVHRKLIGGVTAAIAVLALTYSAASALVTGAAGSSAARSDYATVMKAASAEYRRARVDCLALPFERRDTCIGEAHANEAKMRTAAMTAPSQQLSQLRQNSDQVLLAAQGLDNIVLEPACNIVLRSSASVCEIQVKGSLAEGPEGLAALASPGAVPMAAAAIVPAVAKGDRAGRPSGAHWVPVSGAQGGQYFTNVAGVVSP